MIAAARVRAGTLPLAVHAACRADPDTAAAVLAASSPAARTPEPIRQARRVARETRAEEAEWTGSTAATDATPGASRPYVSVECHRNPSRRRE